jgi:hypothetical protein
VKQIVDSIPSERRRAMKPTPSEDLLFVGTHGYVAA